MFAKYHNFRVSLTAETRLDELRLVDCYDSDATLLLDLRE